MQARAIKWGSKLEQELRLQAGAIERACRPEQQWRPFLAQISSQLQKANGLLLNDAQQK
jgi:hypothetical protein